MTSPSERSRRRYRAPTRPVWRRVEYWIVFAVAATMLSLPVMFLLGVGQPGRESVREFIADRSQDRRIEPESLGSAPVFKDRNSISLEDEGPDRVTDEEARVALSALEEAVSRFDRDVRRIEAARENGEYHGSSGDPTILLSVFAPVALVFSADLERAGVVVGFGGDPDADVELTPLRAAYFEASRLPAAIERAWLGGRSLAELEARDSCRKAIEAARRWVDDR